MRLRLFGLLIFAIAACHSGVREGGGPIWIQQASRTVDNGYLVYVGTGEDEALERARFKAESEAIADLSNECSFPPKGARIEDHYDEPLPQGGHRAWAKLGISFEECEKAKQTIDPEAIRASASLPMTAQLKKYQELIEEPHPGTPEEQGQSTIAQGEPSSSATVIEGPTHFFIVRQQVAYLKQQIILAPAGFYVPRAPRTIEYFNVVRPATISIQNFEKTNPFIRSGNTTWSHLPNKPAHLAPHAMSFRQAPQVFERPREPRMRPLLPQRFSPGGSAGRGWRGRAGRRR